jgi:hypothetical protein
VASLGDLLDMHMSRLRHGLLVVPACSDCNSRLAGYVAFSVTAKRSELKARLRRRWRRLLDSYDWQEEELDPLGRTLRRHIEAAEAARMAIFARLAFPRAGEAALLRAQAADGVF